MDVYMRLDRMLGRDLKVEIFIEIPSGKTEVNDFFTNKKVDF